MDCKPLVTFAGDRTVFSNLESGCVWNFQKQNNYVWYFKSSFSPDNSERQNLSREVVNFRFIFIYFIFVLFLFKGLVSGLPTEAVDWKRSYGRTSKSVYVEANFTPFDSEILSPSVTGVSHYIVWVSIYSIEYLYIFLFSVYFYLYTAKSEKNNFFLQSMIGQPVFHTYWTDCLDLDSYKANVRDDIQASFPMQNIFKNR